MYQELAGSFDTGTSTSITVEFEIDGSGTATAGVSLDDFFLNDIGNNAAPEPASWGLLAIGLAGVALLTRRRRYIA